MVGKKYINTRYEKGFKIINWNPFQFQKYDKKNIAGLAKAKMLSNGALDKGNKGLNADIVEFSSLGLINPLAIQIVLFGLKNGHRTSVYKYLSRDSKLSQSSLQRLFICRPRHQIFLHPPGELPKYSFWGMI